MESISALYISAHGNTLCSTDLECYDRGENSARNVHFLPTEHHNTATQLTDQVGHHEHRGQEPAAPPCSIDVVPLLVPLCPHANTVLQKRGDQAEAGDVGENVLAMTEDL